MTPRLKDGDHLVTAFAAPASGPGWSNRPVWAVVRSRDGTLRMECLQPEEQTRDIQVGYQVSAAAHEAMTAAVRDAMRGGK